MHNNRSRRHQTNNRSNNSPPYNPYSNNKTPYNRRNNKFKLIVNVLLVGLLAIWFLTPVSDIITSLLLLTIPITTDVQRKESWYEMKKSYTITIDKWGVESIGNDLVRSTILNQSNLNRLCHTMSSSPSSKEQSFLSDTFTTILYSFINTKEQCQQKATQYEWSFKVIKSSNINAFALPGGIIIITDTLLKKLKLSKGEIAALIGHEMSHILYRHSQSQLLKKHTLQYIISATFYDDGDDDDETFGEALYELMISSASFLGSMKFSRENEYEADNGSWNILSHSLKYNPLSVQGLLEKLYSSEGGEGGGGIDGGGRSSSSSKRGRDESSSFMSAWDKTHPGTGDRIKVLKQKWSKLTWDEKRQFQTLL
jgi:Zn-dependent protease with chaperone function